jgi:hypothetical protein
MLYLAGRVLNAARHPLRRPRDRVLNAATN